MSYFYKRIFIGFIASLLISVFTLGSNPLGNNVHVIEKGNSKYLSNIIVVKLKERPAANFDGSVQLSPSLAGFINVYGLISANALFPNKTFNDNLDFNRIVIINYSSDADPNFVSSKISKLNEVEWAEPKFVYELVYIPNDPNFGSQWNLSIIDAALAWDVTKGDTSVIIGIVDTGVDWDHC